MKNELTVNIDSANTFGTHKTMVLFHIPRACFDKNYDLDGEAVLQNGELHYDFETGRMFKDMKELGYFDHIDYIPAEVSRLIFEQLEKLAA